MANDSLGKMQIQNGQLQVVQGSSLQATEAIRHNWQRTVIFTSQDMKIQACDKGG